VIFVTQVTYVGTVPTNASATAAGASPIRSMTASGGAEDLPPLGNALQGVASAPAVADPEVNGMTTRELFKFMNKLRGLDIVGADIVCFCPPLDNPGQITALTASEIMLQFVAHMANFRARSAGKSSA
jgi:arginase family protein